MTGVTVGAVAHDRAVVDQVLDHRIDRIFHHLRVSRCSGAVGLDEDALLAHRHFPFRLEYAAGLLVKGALKLGRQIGDRRTIAHCHLAMIYIGVAIRDTELARTHDRECLEVARDMGGPADGGLRPPYAR